MGGLKSERRKWIHSFQNTNIVIFFVDISAFDQITPQHLNKLYESKLIFESAMELFRHCSFIIFLNKLDLFEVNQQTLCILKSNLCMYMILFLGKDPEVIPENLLSRISRILKQPQNFKKIHREHVLL